MYILRILQFLLISHALAACSQNPSPITNKSNFIYSKDALYEMVTVQAGDTLSTIGKKYGIDAQDLAKYNEIIDTNYLEVGKTIKIPLFKVHIVQAGETLGQIAAQYKLHERDILHHNHLPKSRILVRGMQLKIPICSMCNYSTTTNNSPSYTDGADDDGETSPVPIGHDIPAHQHSVKQGTLDDAYNDLPPSDASITSPKEAELEELPENQLSDAGKPAMHAKTSQSANSSSLSAATPLGSANFEWPVQGKVLQHYGEGKVGFSEGISIAAPEGTNVKAASGGTVIHASNGHDKYGNLIIIKHNDDYLTAYAHNSQLLVKQGSKVKKGQAIAKVGKTGDAKVSQVHFSIRHHEMSLNPEKAM